MRNPKVGDTVLCIQSIDKEEKALCIAGKLYKIDKFELDRIFLEGESATLMNGYISCSTDSFYKVFKFIPKEQKVLNLIKEVDEINEGSS